MNKLAKLKGRLTLTAAARQLTVSMAAPCCTPADVLRIGLNGRLVLSVCFPSPVTLLRSDEQLVNWQIGQGHTADRAGDRRTATSDEIWDLPLSGSERASVEERLQLLAGSGRLGVRPRFPAYVKGQDGELWRLVSPGLPPNSEIVIRSDALAALEASEDARTEAVPNTSKEPGPENEESLFSTREKTTLLTVIAAACSIPEIDLAEHGSQKKLITAAAELGVPISAPTMTKIAREVREAVDNRKSKAGNILVKREKF